MTRTPRFSAWHLARVTTAVAAAALAALCVAPAAGGRGHAAQAAAQCADLGEAQNFGLFVRNDLNFQNNSVRGRVAVGRDATLNSLGIGQGLTNNAARIDLMTGGAINGANAAADHGSITYGTTRSPNIYTNAPGGTITQKPLPFAMGNLSPPTGQWLTLTQRSAEYADAPAIAPQRITDAGGNLQALRFTGTDRDLNVFEVTTGQLQGGAPAIQVNVPVGAAIVINVIGASYDSDAAPRTNTVQFNLNGTYSDFQNNPPADVVAWRHALLWNFTAATSVRIGSIAWQGTILAPYATVSLDYGVVFGSVIANNVTGSSTIYDFRPTGCFGPPPAAFDLDALGVDTVTNNLQMRLRNSSSTTRHIVWLDIFTAESGEFDAPPHTDTIFNVADGAQEHLIYADDGTTLIASPGTSRPITGQITVTKLVTGEGPPPSGPWTITISSTAVPDIRVPLLDGQSDTVTVPGGYEPATTPIGQYLGGYTYVISEEDADRLGAATVTVSRIPVTILDGEHEDVTVGNDYPAGAGDGGGPVINPLKPVVINPLQPEIPPGAVDPPHGPDLISAPSLTPASDLAISEQITPRRIIAGDVVRVTVRVRNLSATTAAHGVVGREIPQRNPSDPNSVAQIISASVVGAPARAAAAGLTCTQIRPVRCDLGTLAPGAQVTIRARARVLATGQLKSVLYVSSDTAETNTTNNTTATGLTSAHAPPRARVRVTAPAATSVGSPVSYRVTVTGGGSDGARSVRLCHRPRIGLRVTSAPGTVRRSGRLCRDISHLRAGQTAGFVVHAVAGRSAGGRRVVLAATATAPYLHPAAAGADRIAVHTTPLGAHFTG